MHHDSVSPTLPRPSTPTIPSPSSEANPSKARFIVGGALGGALTVLLVILVTIIFLRRRRQRSTRRVGDRLEGDKDTFADTSSPSPSLPTHAVTPDNLTVTTCSSSSPPSSPVYSRSRLSLSSRLSESHSVGTTSARTQRQLHLQELTDNAKNQMILQLQASNNNVTQEVERLREQVQWLMAQQNSDCALGLTDEPPPSYSE